MNKTIELHKDFITLFIEGRVDEEDIDDYIDFWHNSNISAGLHVFLGMTNAEYGHWINDPECLPHLARLRLNPIVTDDYDVDYSLNDHNY